ncbi:hypothetical protein RND71_028524 [Anisodus tanguticus]|uniref:Uncharacterized protein n=1 Tax=Anisodus tanguticus TaxID=243964 RepID=A0AAE1V767_9SOLA|nr:hypothetical protein RND71_028524 [Anisodus tanguticus]
MIIGVLEYGTSVWRRIISASIESFNLINYVVVFVIKSVVWLDSKDEGSVVYVSLGSLAVLKEEQKEEVLQGLLESERPFLWVIRSSNEDGENKKENDELNGKGMIVSWCSQMEWLDSKDEGSVVYVSLGSLAVLKEEQKEEVLQGLLESERPFLWVIRSSNEDGENKKENDELNGKGMIVSWCSQMEWLDSKDEGSVVYVSLGSLAVLKEEQKEEVLQGLLESERPFLWVIRSSNEDGENKKENDELNGKGMIVSWCSQMEWLDSKDEGSVVYVSLGSLAVLKEEQKEEVLQGLLESERPFLWVIRSSNEDGENKKENDELNGKGMIVSWCSQMEWLDSKDEGSVVYVSLGSLAVLKEEQKEEVLQCLLESERPFLWVIRSSNEDGENKKENDELNGKGMIVSWCSQMEWLDSKDEGSVVYVSLGSLAVLKEEQKEEVLQGLLESERPFLWVIRSSNEDGENKKENDELNGKGMIVSWCSQMEWLDSKDEGSVVYVSLGSLAVLKEEQKEEVLQGLLESERPFLWVIRSSNEDGENKKENDELNGKGMIVSWCSQMEWLDSKDEGSVVYVSLGSLAVLKEEQKEEVLQGLLESERPFLWVIRSSNEDGENKKENDELNGKGMIVSWCSQMEWLDSKDEGSVVYVSLGSLAVFKEEQKEEVLQGLLESERPFLWVIRSSNEDGENKKENDELNGKGMIVSWCSQMEDEGSVVYVSLGSLAVLKEEQKEEVLQGLLESERPFLWVIRSSNEDGENKKENDELNGKGMIVSWCSQMEWLDSKDDGSVVYVSFGSLAVLKEEQKEEVLQGLLESERPFLWVIRSSNEDGENKKENDELNGKGMICLLVFTNGGTV